MLRNVASQRWRVYAWDATTGLPKTGDAANITGKITKDDGTPAATNDVNPDEVDSTDEKGFYAFNLTQAETSAAKVTLSCKSTTSNIVVMACPPVVYTVAQYDSLNAIDSSGRGDVGKINGVSTSSVTTVNANVGTTQPTNFTGTGGSALVKSDAIDIGSTAQTAKDLGAINVTNLNTLSGHDPGGTLASASDAATIESAIAALNNLSAAAAADAVWDELTSGHAISGSFGKLGTDLSTAVAALPSASANATAVWAAGTRTLTANTNLNDPTAAAIADAVWDELLSGHVTTGSFGKWAADLATSVAALPTANGVADAILDRSASGHTSNNTLGAIINDVEDGGRTDTLIDSIVTDVLAVQTALAVVDSNVDSILDDTGTSGVVVASLSAGAVDSIHDDAITEPTGMFAWASATPRKIMATLGVLMRNEIDSDADSVDVRNDADDATLWSYASSDDGSTYISGEAA